VQLPARPPFSGTGTLVSDRTGVGQAVVDLFKRQGLRPITVFFTGGDRTHADGRDYRVPKAELVNTLIARQDTGEFRAAAALPDREAFEAELQGFRRRLSAAGAVRFEAEEGKHDDLVIAVALAVWWASRPRGERRQLRVIGG
jgi:hypothetical protein